MSQTIMIMILLGVCAALSIWALYLDTQVYELRRYTDRQKRVIDQLGRELGCYKNAVRDHFTLYDDIPF